MKSNFTINLVSHSGPAVGSALYSLGGFPLPFLTVGSLGLLAAIGLFFVVPEVQWDKRDSPDDDTKVLTLKGIAKVFVKSNII